MFSVRAFIVLLLYAITLRDILIDRMKGFSSSVILSILSDTLVHYLLQWGILYGLLCPLGGLMAKPSNSENVFEQA